MKIAIHQPEAFPRLNYFRKIYLSDTFVFLDHVQFSKNYFQNRNIIMQNGSEKYLTMSVIKKHSIRETLIDNKSISKIMKSINSAYKKSDGRDFILGLLAHIETSQMQSLAIINTTFIRQLCNHLNIQSNFIDSSSLELSSKKQELVLDIILRLEADTYLSGLGSKQYICEKLFSEQGIEILWDDYAVLADDTKNLSIIHHICTKSSDEVAELIKS
jgi:hypothetical protein